MMDKPDEGSAPAKDSGHLEVSLLPERPGSLALFLLLLVMAGVVISWLAALLGAALEACLLALWAALALAVAAALLRRVRGVWSKRRKTEPEPLPPEGRNPKPIPEAGESAARPEGERTRRSQRWVFTFERITDENKG
jgi:hypothetical protein